jgi:hypothetical protein
MIKPWKVLQEITEEDGVMVTVEVYYRARKGTSLIDEKLQIGVKIPKNANQDGLITSFLLRSCGDDRVV